MQESFRVDLEAMIKGEIAWQPFRTGIEIHRLYVLPAYHNRGVGTRLLRAALAVSAAIADQAARGIGDKDGEFRAFALEGVPTLVIGASRYTFRPVAKFRT